MICICEYSISKKLHLYHGSVEGSRGTGVCSRLAYGVGAILSKFEVGVYKFHIGNAKIY